MIDVIAAMLVTMVGVWLYCRKKVFIDKYEYLEVLSSFEWKSLQKVREEMEVKKKCEVSESALIYALGDLVHEGLVVDRVRPVEIDDPLYLDGMSDTEVHEFKLTTNGVHRHHHEPSEPDPHELLEPAHV